MFAALALLLSGFLAGMGICGFIWASGERAAKRERIERARRRDHATVPAMLWSSK
jgi:hypothetical protein